MANYNERLLDKKIEKKLKSTGGILLKGVRFCGKTTTTMHHAASFVRFDESETIREQATLIPQIVLETPRLLDEWQLVPNTGNLNNRTFGTRTETFDYDGQNRLKSWYNSSATYFDNGNFQTKTGVGTYSYDAVKKHAVTGVTENIASQNQNIVYNDFEKASSVEEGNYRLALQYGVDNQRVKTFLYENNVLIKEKHFSANYEKVISGQSVRELHYIGAPSGITALMIRSNGVDSLFHVYTDHQGSIIRLTNEAGSVVEERNYDPWGRERNPSNWTYALNSEYRRTDRGYTGHEHLPEFGLINMNARLYDPLLGRFLSPDPFVQAPGLSQSYNRYSYCINNPLIYTDPSGGKWWHWLLGAALLDPISAITTVTATAAGAGTTVGTTAAVIGGTAGVSLSSTLIGAGCSAIMTMTSAAGTLSTVDFSVIYFGTLFKNDPVWGGRRFENWLKMELQPLNSLAGIFSYDKSANWFEWPMQIINNVGGEVLQDIGGYGLGHYYNIGGKIDATGYYKGRMIIRTTENTVNTGISLGHYVFGDGIALSPNDNSQGLEGLDLFAHEFGHTYQSRIAGPLYLFKYGIASAIYQGSTEYDANKRGFGNLGMVPSGRYKGHFESQSYNRYQWYEFLGACMWPFMWMWNR